jgi:Xaa-Pro aminopeptidase
MREFDEKQKRIATLLAGRQLDAMLLQRTSSFSWATCGASAYINTAATNGEASLLITPAKRYLITNNIEAGRLEHEEALEAQGWELRVAPWHEANAAIAELTRGLRFGADGHYPGAVDLSAECIHLRADLTPEEGERFRVLGRLCAEAMDSAIRAVRPGQTEFEIAARLASETLSRGAQPIVNLISTDERVFKYRHPLPTGKKFERYAMLVLCGRQGGLICSVTRLIHLGPLPNELRRKQDACVRVDATYLSATRPGQTLGAIFERAAAVYAETGWANEWHIHHQGGLAGYEPREIVATPGTQDVVVQGQAYAWNPSVAGAKCEDTILVGESENEVLTSIPGWPSLPVTLADGKTFARPVILEIL